MVVLYRQGKSTAFEGKTLQDLARIRIPIRPLSVNEAWKGRRFKTDAYRAFQKHLLLVLRPMYIPPYPLGIRFEFGFSSKNSDIDNPVKTVMDVLCKKYGFDDRYVYRMEIDKSIVPKGSEFIEFEFFPLPGEMMLKPHKNQKRDGKEKED